MRGIKKIEHITTYRNFCADTDNILYDKSTIINEAYIITYAEGQIFVTQNYAGLPKKVKKFFLYLKGNYSHIYLRDNYLHSYNQKYRYTFKHTSKIDTYTFKDPI